jgi:ABC-type amino acid transport substrate-binding protein
VTKVATYDTGIQGVRNHDSDVFFADIALLMEATRRNPAPDLTILPRLYTVEPLALAFDRNDDDLRVIVDRTLSRMYRSSQWDQFFGRWFGRADAATKTYFGVTALPE